MSIEDHTPNSFQCPNIYVDDLAYLLTTDEFKILIFICRRILGFQKTRKIKRNKISLSQICGKILSKKEPEKILSHGVGIGRATAIKCLAELEKFKLILKIGESDKKGQEYEINLGQVEPIDFDGLNARRHKKYSINLKRTKSARVKRSVPQVELVSPTNRKKQNDWLVPLTALVSGTNQKTPFCGKSDLPTLVSGTNPLNTGETHKEEIDNRNTHTVPQNGASKPSSEKKKFYDAEFVLLTDAEYGKLIEKHGAELTKKFIEKLDNWKGVNPKKRKYESDYRAILNWVVSAIKDEIAKEQFRNGQTQRSSTSGRNFGGNSSGDPSKGRVFQPGETGQYGGNSGKRNLRELLDKKAANATDVP